MEKITASTGFSPSESPSLSSGSAETLRGMSQDLQILYKALNDADRRLFSQIYTKLYYYINGRKPDIFTSWWCVNLVRASASLPCSELALLSFLFSLSGGGVDVVSSDVLYRSKILPNYNKISYTTALGRLKRAGYISRSTSDPSRPYLSRSHRRQPVFIKLTGKGIKFCNDINREVNNILMRQSLADITGEQ